jgi:23S rRNA (pseudouridine1915-N3)-methyltransferase
MLITIAAIGRLKAGEERVLFDRFFERAGTAGRKLGLTFTVREFPESRASSAETRKTEEATTVIAALGQRGTFVTLDEQGKDLTSPAFANRIARWRDGGSSDVVFAIGGADGHGAPLLEKAELRLAFGEMTWPHQLVRVMLAEQLYRAVTILSGHPYHRD